MCGITGWVDFGQDLSNAGATIEAMTETLRRRGPDDGGTWTDAHVALGHRRLAIIDPEHGAQPMHAPEGAALVFNGEIYNYLELRVELEALGHQFRTNCDTEVLLRGYMEWKAGVAQKLNGIFAFAVWDAATDELLLVRDRLGVKPLFYYPTPDGLVFGSEPKAILANPLVERSAGREELCDALLFLRTPGRVPFKGMFEVKPGHMLHVRRGSRQETQYWRLEAKPHTDSQEETIATIRRLLDDIVERQMMSDVPLCSLLSGGLDSSAVTALAQRVRVKQGSKLSTFCVDFVGHTEGFQADPIRPSPDAPFAQEVADFVGSDHHVIMLDKAGLLDPRVRKAVLHAWDLPFNFGDLDISLYLLFAGVREHATVALSGEAADELFGGYLWFSDENAMAAETFPWLKLAAHRGLEPSALFQPSFMAQLKLPEYQAELYRAALAEVPRLPGESPREARLREISYITLTRWLPILLEKKDRASMAVGLEGRVPFCDHRLVEYVFNIPWAMKQSYALEKGLLREAVRDVLPESVINRKKAAYPTVQDSGYDRAMVASLQAKASDPASPLQALLSPEGVERLFNKAQDQPLSEFERILVETTVRLEEWLTDYQVELVEGLKPCTASS
ncbi:MAG: asnB [Cyanobacteria bacterium RYN_339]|nr:asnB [Cyanobacteria bacterium RYN_339]